MSGERSSRHVTSLGPAPADARLHAPWPAWRKVLAYAVLAGLAAGAIWFIDLTAHRSGEPQPPRATPADVR